MTDLSLHVLDILRNSIEACSTRVTIRIEEDTRADLLRVTIADNGRGMTPEQVARLGNPFFTTRTTRRVGMGVPLFRQTAVLSGGGLTVESQPGRGTMVTATLAHTHIDRPPLGDIANSVILTATSNPRIGFLLEYVFNGRVYRFDTSEMKEVLGGLSMDNAQVVMALTEMVRTNIDELRS